MLSRDEQRSLLSSSLARPSYRDHLLFATVLGTGLRAFELVALDVGQCLYSGKLRSSRRTIELTTFKRSAASPAPQVVAVPKRLQHKLTQLAKWKRDHGEALDDDAPLFVSRHGARLSRWSLRHAWHRWRDRAELPRSLTFHSLRHTFAQNLYDSCGDIEVVRAAMRHVDVTTTTLYAQASIERVGRAADALPC